MHLTSAHTKRIQTFLFSNGFIQEKPSEIWNPHKQSGYKAYLESKGLPESECREVPYNLGMLTHELREFILIPEKVNVVSESVGSEEDLDEDNEEGSEDNGELNSDPSLDQSSEENFTENGNLNSELEDGDETQYEDE